MWNGRIPDRFPGLIFQAAGEDDVVRALALARERDMKVSVCSGGHSWAGSHLRDGAMLLDVSRLAEISIDAAAATASVGPGVRGSELLAGLRDQELFFPVGHCKGVAL